MKSLIFKYNVYVCSILFVFFTSHGYSQQPKKKAEYNYKLFESMVDYKFSSSYNERGLNRYPKADFDKFVWENYTLDSSKITRIYPGDLIPDDLLDLPLWVVNDEYGRDTISLRNELGEEWTILDVWASHCGPCLKSMRKWEEIVNSNPKIKLMGIYSAPQTYEVAFETRKQQYQSVQIIGRATSILRAMFLGNHQFLGPVIWIRNGKLFGISTGELSDDEYEGILSGKINKIPDHAAFK